MVGSLRLPSDDGATRGSSPRPGCHHGAVAGISRRSFLRGGVGAAVGWKAILDQSLAAMAAGPACGGVADIEHVVFLVQEDRSFDHYFGRYPAVRGFDDRMVRLGGGADGTAVFRRANPGHLASPG